MTLRPVLPVLITIALSGAALGAQAQFTLMATVIDPASGQPPDTLVPADVRVAEDGVAATVTKVESVVRTVKVQVLIDNGGPSAEPSANCVAESGGCSRGYPLMSRSRL